MEATLENGKLTLVLDWDEKGWKKTEGKMHMHASSFGFQVFSLNGKPVKISVNAGDANGR